MARPVKWLFVSGLIGVLAAVVVYALGAIPALRMNIIFNYLSLVLAPASILGLANPLTLHDSLLIVGIVLCTNFLWYGLLGLIVYGVLFLFQRRHPTGTQT